MARFDVSGLDEAIRWMEQMGEETGELADRMLLAGAEKVREAWREAVTLHKHKVTNEMFESIGYARKPKTIDGVKTIDIYPQGKDSKGVRNAEKAFILHYGARSNPGSRWIDDADARSEETVVPEMLKIFDQQMRAWGM